MSASEGNWPTAAETNNAFGIPPSMASILAELTIAKKPNRELVNDWLNRVIHATTATHGELQPGLDQLFLTLSNLRDRTRLLMEALNTTENNYRALGFAYHKTSFDFRHKHILEFAPCNPHTRAELNNVLELETENGKRTKHFYNNYKCVRVVHLTCGTMQDVIVEGPATVCVIGYVEKAKRFSGILDDCAQYTDNLAGVIKMLGPYIDNFANHPDFHPAADLMDPNTKEGGLARTWISKLREFETVENGGVKESLAGVEDEIEACLADWIDHGVGKRLVWTLTVPDPTVLE